MPQPIAIDTNVTSGPFRGVVVYVSGIGKWQIICLRNASTSPTSDELPRWTNNHKGVNCIMLINRRKHHHAFTLIELLVVLAILGLVISLAFPALAAMRGMAYQAQCVTNLKTMGEMSHLYSLDYDGALPHLAADAADEPSFAAASSMSSSTSFGSFKGGKKKSGLFLTGGVGDTLSGIVETTASCLPLVYATFSSDNFSVTASSTKDLSNVVLKFSDGHTEKFDNLSGKTGIFAGTSSNAGKIIVGVWIKSGCNKSGDGPGFGEWLSNPADLTSILGDIVSGGDDDSDVEQGDSSTPNAVTVDVSGWKIFDPRHMVCGEDIFPDYIKVTLDDGTNETRPVSYGANGLLLQSGVYYDDLTAPQKTAMLFDGNPTNTTAQVFDPRHYGEGVVLYGDWHVGQANEMSVDMIGIE